MKNLRFSIIKLWGAFKIWVLNFLIVCHKQFTLLYFLRKLNKSKHAIKHWKDLKSKNHAHSLIGDFSLRRWHFFLFFLPLSFQNCRRLKWKHPNGGKFEFDIFFTPNRSQEWLMVMKVNTCPANKCLKAWDLIYAVINVANLQLNPNQIGKKKFNSTFQH